MNALKETSDRILRSKFVIPLFLLFLVMAFIGVGIEIEDFTTSYIGYSMLPTHKANTWVIYLVALIPQVCGLGFGYLYARNTKNLTYLFISLTCFMIDMVTDVVYKSNGLGVAGVIASILESFFIYILLGKTLLVASTGVLLEILPHFGEQLGHLAGQMTAGSAPKKYVPPPDEEDEEDYLPSPSHSGSPKKPSLFGLGKQ